MASNLVTLRDALKDSIEAAKTAMEFVENDFDVQAAWMPISALEALAQQHPHGKVYLVGMASDDQRAESRSNVTKREFQIMIGLQKAGVRPNDVEAIDLMVELDEQLRDKCRAVAVPGFSWVRNEALKDQSGTAYSYVMLREGHTFESYFTAVFNAALA